MILAWIKMSLHPIYHPTNIMVGNPSFVTRNNKEYAIYNIDNQIIRSCTDKTINFICEKLKVSITHIAGKPPNYNPYVRSLIKKENPNIFICGHSHILRVEFDKKNHFLFINPGAAGRHGFHKKRTMLRFEINGDQIKNMEIIELGNRSKLS